MIIVKSVHTLNARECVMLEAGEILGKSLWIATRVEASLGAIGEVGRRPAFEKHRRRRRCAI